MVVDIQIPLPKDYTEILRIQGIVCGDMLKGVAADPGKPRTVQLPLAFRLISRYNKNNVLQREEKI